MTKPASMAADTGLPDDIAVPPPTLGADMTRRDVLKAGSKAAALATLPAAALATSAMAGAEDPVLPLYRQWMAARRDWYRHTGADVLEDWDENPASKAAQDREDAAFWAMVDMAPTSMAGIAALAHVLWDVEGPSAWPGSETYSEQARAPSCKLMLQIWRATSGQSGMPPAFAKGEVA